MCVYQEANGDNYLCPVQAVTRRFLHLRAHNASHKEVLSTYWNEQNMPHAVTAEHMSCAIKLAATMLQYPTKKGIPIDLINTHSFRSGGANALALSGYSNTQIQKMGRWRRATFKEYIREQLACFSVGMSKSMKQSFHFVNIAGNALHDITDEIIATEYLVTPPAA